MQSNVPAYLTYPKQFTPYKWYKPLLVGLLTIVFCLLFSFGVTLIGTVIGARQGYDVLKMINGGYNTMDVYTIHGAIISLGSVAVFLPALLIGNRIVNSRSFSSYSSSRGGFDFGVFFKTLAGALVCIGIPLTVQTLLTEKATGNIRFTVIGIILCVILVPLQCFAEEYIFRGLIMQAFGSWIRIPVIPIILQTILFAAGHPYNLVGVISISVTGIALGICTVVTNGLEASCAAHTVNNLAAFLFAGFGFGAIRSQVDVFSMVMTVCCMGLYIGFLVFAKKKLGWFDKVKKDDAAQFNAKISRRAQPVPVPADK
ncbi:type II CAAX endopeptidase family protein [uncultured Ruminococcus sp.]|uniref:CPBP family intramembrane glutamic endopeptidase n=1 Tax=uncultured Ruminococcus sp. TaxID=165186 RepID=UPI00292D0DDA|nr:type II CAAX endopeptidase family protein [uncultured Ruminococcus sp.]